MSDVSIAIEEVRRAIAEAAPDFMPDLVTIHLPTSTKSPGGGNVPGEPQIVAANVPCRLRAASGHEIEIAGGTQGGMVVVVETPAWHGSGLLTINSRHRLLVAAGTQPEQTLNVIAPLPATGPFLEIIATRTI